MSPHVPVYNNQTVSLVTTIDDNTITPVHSDDNTSTPCSVDDNDSCHKEGDRSNTDWSRTGQDTDWSRTGQDTDWSRTGQDNRSCLA